MLSRLRYLIVRPCSIAMISIANRRCASLFVTHRAAVAPAALVCCSRRSLRQHSTAPHTAGPTGYTLQAPRGTRSTKDIAALESIAHSLMETTSSSSSTMIDPRAIEELTRMKDSNALDVYVIEHAISRLACDDATSITLQRALALLIHLDSADVWTPMSCWTRVLVLLCGTSGSNNTTNTTTNNMIAVDRALRYMLARPRLNRFELEAIEALTSGFAAQGNMLRALELVDRLVSDAGLTPNIEIFNKCLAAAASRKSVALSSLVLEHMSSVGIPLDSRSLQLWLESIARSHDIDSIAAHFDRVLRTVVSQRRRSAARSRTPSAPQAVPVSLDVTLSMLESFIDTLADRNLRSIAVRCVERIKEHGVSPSLRIWHSILLLHARAFDSLAALHTIVTMDTVKPDIESFRLAYRACERSDLAAMAVLDRIHAASDVRQSSDATHRVEDDARIELSRWCALAHSQQLDKVMALMSHSPSRFATATYDALLDALVESNQARELVAAQMEKLIGAMRRQQVPPTIDTLNVLLRFHLKHEQFELASELLQQLLHGKHAQTDLFATLAPQALQPPVWSQQPLAPNTATVAMFVTYHLAHKQLEHALAMLAHLPPQADRSSVIAAIVEHLVAHHNEQDDGVGFLPTHHALLRTLVDASSAEQFEHLLQEASRLGVTLPSSVQQAIQKRIEHTSKIERLHLQKHA